MSVKTGLSSSSFLRSITWLLCWIAIFIPASIAGQNPPSILRSESPPDIAEKYQANPRFYEVMSAFPHPNSYTRYNFEEVKRAARHDPAMMVILGDHYRIGRSTPLDYRKAQKEYEKAAARGYAMANHRMAYMYADGLGLPKEKEKILHFMKISADGGYELAQYDYALVYLNGKFNEPRDFVKAYKYLKMAADQGHRLSMESLAMLSFHPESVPAGLPCGLKEALEWYRKAGDTDGERALKEKIGSIGGLRYYLRTIPGFIPGLQTDADLANPAQGLAMIRKLEQHQSLLGETLFDTYRREIAENILYRFYFEAQQKPDDLLRFIVFCHIHDSILNPYQLRYNEAAGRDFRLVVNFTDVRSLTPFLERFSAYPKVFTQQELLIVADRVYVALMLKDISAALQNPLDQFLVKNTWVIRNLTARYIAHFENQQFSINRNQLLNNPYRAGGYLEEVFSRYGSYRSSETDTLEMGIIPEIRLHCLHPYLTDQLISNISNIRHTRTIIHEIVHGLKTAQETFRKDINTYWSLLLKESQTILKGVTQTGDASSMATQIRMMMQVAGEKRLDQVCQTLRTNDARAYMVLDQASIYEIMEMMTGNNLPRYTKVSQLAIRNTLMVSNSAFTDPNGVNFVPVITERALPDPGCCTEKITEHFYRIYHTSALHLTAASLIITNKSSIPMQVTLWLQKASEVAPEATGVLPSPVDPFLSITPAPILIAPGESITLEPVFPAGVEIPDLVLLAHFHNMHQTLIMR